MSPPSSSVEATRSTCLPCSEQWREAALLKSDERGKKKRRKKKENIKAHDCVPCEVSKMCRLHSSRKFPSTYYYIKHIVPHSDRCSLTNNPRPLAPLYWNPSQILLPQQVKRDVVAKERGNRLEMLPHTTAGAIYAENHSVSQP